ncbi:hypothetical protein [Haladaptatus sp. R4]|uniref:hypothetical protein n=1 Tax=Haladaptatus sp. R4 TaxID=1679489 RepID=UPI001CBCADE7|nr:hypothetical protein [Haladaptatus sp. R4]
MIRDALTRTLAVVGVPIHRFRLVDEHFLDRRRFRSGVVGAVDRQFADDSRRRLLGVGVLRGVGVLVHADGFDFELLADRRDGTSTRVAHRELDVNTGGHS